MIGTANCQVKAMIRLGPVAKFASEPRNGRIDSAFKLGCPRMAVVKCGPARSIPQPFSNFAIGPLFEQADGTECSHC